MIEPYKSIFIEITPLLERLGFSRGYDEAFGAGYRRNDGYFLRISIERTMDGCSAVLEKDGAGIRGGLVPFILMDAIAPSMRLKAEEGLRNGYNPNAELAWWKLFLSFLIKYESIVFRFPSTAADPFWRAYVEIYNRDARKLGIDTWGQIDV
jgi:hypothetical protein